MPCLFCGSLSLSEEPDSHAQHVNDLPANQLKDIITEDANDDNDVCRLVVRHPVEALPCALPLPPQISAGARKPEDTRRKTVAKRAETHGNMDENNGA